MDPAPAPAPGTASPAMLVAILGRNVAAGRRRWVAMAQRVSDRGLRARLVDGQASKKHPVQFSDVVLAQGPNHCSSGITARTRGSRTRDLLAGRSGEGCSGSTFAIEPGHPQCDDHDA